MVEDSLDFFDSRLRILQPSRLEHIDRAILQPAILISRKLVQWVFDLLESIIQVP